MTANLDLAGLKTLAEAATPGPWHTEEPIALGVGWSGGAICIVHGLPAPPQSQRNAAFIAALDPQTVLALIAAAEEPTDFEAYESAMVRALGAERLKVDLLKRSIEELAVVATEAAFMLAETNHGGLTFARSESMLKALRAAGVSIPAQCSACPHGLDHGEVPT